MRKFQLTLLLLLLTVTATFAQRGAARGGQQMLEELDLTTEQQTAIMDIRKDTRAQMLALRENGKSREENREQARALRKKSKDAVLAILSPEQRAQLEEKAAARKEAWTKVDKEAMRAELKAYRTETMEPVLRAARGQLDRYIDQADQSEIERLRAVFATRPNKPANGPKTKKSDKEAREQAREQARAAAKEWRAEHAEDLASLKALTEKYGAELERAEKVLAPQRETWREEMAAIRAKYLPEQATQRAKGRRAQSGEKTRGGKRGEGRNGAEKGKRDRVKAGAFLLLKS